MSTKTVALDEESYGLLTRQKRAGETYSDTVRRLASPRGSILDFWGMWDKMSEDEVADVRAARDRGRKRDAQRLERVTG